MVAGGQRQRQNASQNVSDHYFKRPSVPISRTDRASGESGLVPENSSGQPLLAGALSREFTLATRGRIFARHRLALRELISPHLQYGQWDILANQLKSRQFC